jgi:hypothetical protein
MRGMPVFFDDGFGSLEIDQEAVSGATLVPMPEAQFPITARSGNVHPKRKLFCGAS